MVSLGKVEASQASWTQRLEEDSGQAGIEPFNEAQNEMLWSAVYGWHQQSNNKVTYQGWLSPADWTGLWRWIDMPPSGHV